MKYLTVFVFVCLLTSVIIAQNDTTEKILLKMNLEKDKTYKMAVVTEQKIEQEIMGNKQTIEQTVGMGMDYKVDNIESNQDILVTATYTSVQFKQKSPMGDVDYNSQTHKGEIPEMAKGFAVLVGLFFQTKMDSKGEIKEVMGIEKMVETMAVKLDVPEQMKDSFKKQMQAQLGTEVFKNQIYAVFPEKPIAIGESWKKSLEISGSMPMVMETTWTLKDRKDGLVLLDIQSVIKEASTAKPVEMGYMKVSYKVSGTQTGTVSINERTGWIVKGTIAQKMHVDANIESPNLPNPMTIPMEIESKVLTSGE